MEAPAEELLKKLQELEVGQAMLKQEMSKLMPGGGGGSTAGLTRFHLSGHLVPLRRWRGGRAADATTALRRGGGVPRLATHRNCRGRTTNRAPHQGNRSIERLYGYSASEALGKDAIKLFVDSNDFCIASSLIHRITLGESWTGKFLVKNIMRDQFLVIITNTPFYDDDGSLVGIICVSTVSKFFQEVTYSSYSKPMAAGSNNPYNPRKSFTSKGGSDFQQPFQVVIASTISNLATKVTNKVCSHIRTNESSTDQEARSGDGQQLDHDAIHSDHREDAMSSGASTPRGDAAPSPFGVFSSAGVDEKYPSKIAKGSNEEAEGKARIHKIISSKAEAWIAKKGISWHWKGSENDDNDIKNRFAWPWLHSDQEGDTGHAKSSKFSSKPEENIRLGNNNAPGSWSPLNAYSTSSISSRGSTCNNVQQKLDLETDCLDYEILWEDLTIREQIGQDSQSFQYKSD